MLTEKDKAALNAAKVGDTVALSDGRKVEVVYSNRISDCYKCELHNENCDGLPCGINNVIYELTR